MFKVDIVSSLITGVEVIAVQGTWVVDHSASGLDIAHRFVDTPDRFLHLVTSTTTAHLPTLENVPGS